jgi:hypothetical protein
MTSQRPKFKMNLPSPQGGWLPACSCPRHKSEEEKYRKYTSRPWYKYRTDKGGNPLPEGERQRHQERMISGRYDHSREIIFTRNHYIEDEKMFEQYLCETHLSDYQVIRDKFPGLYWAINKLFTAYGVRVLDVDMYSSSCIDDLRDIDAMHILRADDFIILVTEGKVVLNIREVGMMTHLLRGDEALYQRLYLLAMTRSAANDN